MLLAAEGEFFNMAEKKSMHLLELGDELEPLEFLVTPEWNQQYLYAEEDFHPRYIEGSESGGPLVHPALLLNMSNRTKSPSYYVAPGWSGIHATDETKFLNPARVGKRFTVTWKVAEIYEKRGRPWQRIDALVVDEDGTEILYRRAFNTFSSPELAKKRRD